MLLYDYQYDIAAIIVLGFIFFSFHLRKTFIGRSGKIFTWIMVLDLAAAMFDWISCYTISYPKGYPLWFNYVISLGYLFFYNELASVYLLYIDSKTKIKKFRKPVNIYFWGLTVFYAVVIFSSPFTHLVAYFDENYVYLHGPVMTWLYVIPFINFAIEIVLFIIGRSRINFYQFLASITLVIATGGSVVISIINNRLLIGQLVIATTMFFVYLAFENPAYYTYKESQVMNDLALRMHLKYNKHQKKDVMLLFVITNYAAIEDNYSMQNLNSVNNAICDWLFSKFKKTAYCLEDGYFVIQSDLSKVTYAINMLEKKFEQPIVFSGDQQVQCDIFVGVVEDLYEQNFTYMEQYKILLTKLKEKDDTRSARDVLDYIAKKENHEKQILAAIKKAIENDSFQVFFQPIYSYYEKKFTSAEALIRLFDDEIGFINPEELIVLAEKNGYINKIGEIVFEKVCRFIQEEKLDELGIKYIEVNLSPIQCYREDLVDSYMRIMNRYQVRSEQINLEITETSESQYNSLIERNIENFLSYGVTFSIDDFGSGFASLSYLIRYPVAIIKIDKEILWTAMKDEAAMIVLSNTIRMAKELKKKIVVEGVENQEMIDVLNQNGCDYHQGFFYSKPIPPQDFVTYIKEKNCVG